MPMNIAIQERRKQLGLTQEQVADYLGVSTPAVSKWENGITSPDIGLLPPLARLLKTDLNSLFCFDDELSPQEVGHFCNELASAAKENYVSAFTLAEDKIHTFPHNEQLLLNVAIILDSLLLSEQEDSMQGNFEEKISSWYSRLTKSSDDRIRNSACYMKASRYIRQDKLDAAQEMLDAIQDKEEISALLPDKLMLQVSILLKQGKADLAALELEKSLYRSVTRIQLLLSKLVDAELEAGRKDIAEKIGMKAMAASDLFDMWKYTGYTASYQIAQSEKDAERTLSLLEQMLDALVQPWSPAESALYHRTASMAKNFQAREILSVILKELETSSECEYLRGHPKYRTIIEKHKDIDNPAKAE